MRYCLLFLLMGLSSACALSPLIEQSSKGEGEGEGESCDPDNDGFGCNEEDCAPDDPLRYREGVFYVDADNDGYSAIGPEEILCYGEMPPEGYIDAPSDPVDCDDNNPNVFEIESFAFLDADADGYAGKRVALCEGAPLPDGYEIGEPANAAIDCDDSDAQLYLTEYPDSDSDGVPEDDARVCPYEVDFDCAPNDNLAFQIRDIYEDQDGDGYTSTTFTSQCVGENALTQLVGPDCNDADPDVFQQRELYEDDDNDGYTEEEVIDACVGSRPPTEWQFEPSTYPDCDRRDPNRGESLPRYLDEDGDGFTSAAFYPCIEDIGQNNTWLENGSAEKDCFDRSARAFPGPHEDVCDGLDNNCDGTIDENSICEDCEAFWVEDENNLSNSQPYFSCGGGSYTGASESCEDSGYTLATFVEESEWERIRESSVFEDNTEYWIGLTDLDSEGDYFWNGSDPLSYNAFSALLNNSNNRDCVSVGRANRIDGPNWARKRCFWIWRHSALCE